MAASTPARGRLRRLAELRPERGRMPSVSVDPDPATIPTGRERALGISSALDRAATLVRDQPDLGPHGGVAALLRS